MQALSEKIAIVTGASRGIGAAISRAFAAEGATLMLVALNEQRLHDFAAQLPTRCVSIAIDLRAPDAAQKIVEATKERFGGIDIIVNNAGAPPRGDIHALSDAAWEDAFALKFFGAMRLCRAAWPQLKARRGCIVNIAGAAGRTGAADFAAHGAVNAALLNLTKVLADRGIGDGVRVNAINPGFIATERMPARLAAYAAQKNISEAEAARRMPAAYGLERFGLPEEVAAVAAFLASAEAAYIQGAIFDVDGGLTRTL